MANPQAAQVIAVAKSQVGYHEGYSEGGWNNINKYADEVPGLGWSQGQSYCAVFTSWVAMRAGVPSLFPRTADCSAAITWFTSRNRWSWYPAIGAQVMYGTDGQEHTGIVFAYDSTYIWAVEANTNSNGSIEGDGVYIRQRRRTDAVVYGYGLPAYAEGVITADPNLAGKPGFTYAASALGPGPATLRAGGLMVNNFVADTVSVNGTVNAGRVFIQQNDKNTVGLEVVGASSSAPSIALFRDADGNTAFEVTGTGSPVSRKTHFFPASVQIGSTTADLGGSTGAVISIKNVDTAPTSDPTNGGILFVEEGALKYRGSAGTVTTIAPA